jgi:hypothetical protein
VGILQAFGDGATGQQKGLHLNAVLCLAQVANDGTLGIVPRREQYLDRTRRRYRRSASADCCKGA